VFCNPRSRMRTAFRPMRWVWSPWLEPAIQYVFRSRVSGWSAFRLPDDAFGFRRAP
jgi:hypothetical protein